ncbi:MAG: metallophosphoesterase [Acidobacteria bacterium]|nr:metallophosphoesterase [Acidobacteriota bacterium]
MPRRLLIIAALVVFCGVLFGWHYFLYTSTVHFFGIAGRGGRRALAALLVLLPTSFFVSLFLARRAENGFVKAVYVASNLWLGVGLTLMVFFALAWAAWGVSRFHNPRPSPLILGFVAVLLTCAYSAYGVWNARHPRVENVTVKINNLPPVWRERKLVQISDLHLGLTLGPAFLQQVVQLVNAQDPAAVFITGDLFDGEDRGLETFIGPLNQINAPLGAYFVTGNHEIYLGLARALEILKRTKVRILDDEMVMVDGLQILGIGYPTRGFSRDIAAAILGIPGFDRDKPSVLLYHSPTQVSVVKAAGVSFQVSGHTHHGQVFPVQFLTRLIYGKYDHGLNAAGGFTIYTSSGTGTWGPLMRTGNHPEVTVIHLDPM